MEHKPTQGLCGSKIGLGQVNQQERRGNKTRTKQKTKGTGSHRTRVRNTRASSLPSLSHSFPLPVALEENTKYKKNTLGETSKQTSQHSFHLCGAGEIVAGKRDLAQGAGRLRTLKDWGAGQWNKEVGASTVNKETNTWVLTIDRGSKEPLSNVYSSPPRYWLTIPVLELFVVPHQTLLTLRMCP
jgi:hypothetical protein